MSRTDDIRFMQRALALAEHGRGLVEPNPMVGCVLVRNGRIVGEGRHERFGSHHAEVNALRKCRSARGATAYVTLEPCAHWGKTPPCADALIAAGVRRVVVAVRDPNPVSTGGIAKLRDAGIRVDIGVCTSEAATLAAPFFKLVQQKRPWVILKWAQSLDGNVATRTGDSRWISDEASRKHAHQVRGVMDAIVVGIDTVLRDDPLLTCREETPRRIATRIVLDAGLRIAAPLPSAESKSGKRGRPRLAQLVQTARRISTVVFCVSPSGKTIAREFAARRRKLESAGVCVEPLPTVSPARRAPARLPLDAILDRLGEQKMTNVLVEGGGRLLGSFFDERLADEVHIYIAPLLIGGAAAVGALNGVGPALIAEAHRWAKAPAIARLGDGWFLQARLWE